MADELGQLTTTEIFDIPNCIRRSINSKANVEDIAQKILGISPELIVLTGSGTSYHAGMAAHYWFVNFARVPTLNVLSPEFKFQMAPVLSKRHVVIMISQSGKSKEAIESARTANEVGALTVAVTNHEDSELARVCKYQILLRCGEEQSVLATKTYVSSLAVLFYLALKLAKFKQTLDHARYQEFLEALKLIPGQIEVILPQLRKHIRKVSRYYKFVETAFVLGAGLDFATAQETALKLKEGARIHAQAYSTAEFPHGPITLADPSAWIISIIPHESDPRRGPILRLLKRIKSRGATILGIVIQTSPTNELELLDSVVNLPSCPMQLFPLLSIIPIQLLSVEIAVIKELNPDTPKFLTKVSGIDIQD